MTLLRTPSEQQPGRMAALARLPVFFALEGKRVITAGGSAAAAWKAELLAAAGAQVEVFALEYCEELRALAGQTARASVTLVCREWTAGDLRGAALAVGAFESEDAAAAFAAAARQAGVPVNVIDKPAYCDFAFGSIVNRSPLVIGISTDGAAPVFAQAIRAKIEAMLPQGFALWAAAAARWRGMLKQSGLPFAGRRKFWQLFTRHAIAHPNDVPGLEDYEQLLADVRDLGGAVETGAVTLVGAGPGDPELLTLRAVRALQTADVILFDDLVAKDVLDFARREAKKILVGKTGHRASCRQDDINRLMVGLARAGRHVVRLKGGDPLIFARADEEIAACAEAAIAVEIVPGISAVQGAASRLGVPLTGRGKSRRVQLVTGHSRDGGLPDDIDWRSLADPAATTAVYMPVGTLPRLVEGAVAAGLDPLTPAVAISNATRHQEKRIAASIGELPQRLAEAALEGPVLVMIGSVFGAAKQHDTKPIIGPSRNSFHPHQRSASGGSEKRWNGGRCRD
ncbi:MAG: uroporphyrinogen-III C-methyltransferase [Pseudolabrys sp.]|nr:uroporphyrinogen-III C-methyltransferase [Pseudolabrys sp.]